MIFPLATVAAVVATWILGTTTDIDLLNRIAQLDTPSLLLVFIWALYKRKLVWGYQWEDERTEKLEWKKAALTKTEEKERSATIAEEALRAGLGLRGKR